MNDNEKKVASSTMAEAQSSIGGIAFDIKNAATHKFEEAMTGARAKADDGKAEAASEVNDVAKALRCASEQLRGGSVQERTLGQLANSLGDASDMIRDKDLGEIAQSVSKVARDNPVLFFSGAALLGFVASRYVKASADEASKSDKSRAVSKTQIDDFVGEGNPNTQDIGGTA